MIQFNPFTGQLVNVPERLSLDKLAAKTFSGLLPEFPLPARGGNAVVDPTTNFELRTWTGDASWVYALDSPQIDVPSGVVYPEPDEGSLGNLVITGGDSKWGRGKHLIDGHGLNFDTGDGPHNMVHVSRAPMSPQGQTTDGHFYRTTTPLTKQCIFDGNSMTQGNATPYYTDYPQIAWNEQPAEWLMRNVGIGGQSTVEMISRGPSFVDVHYNTSKWSKNILVAWEMSNDFVTNNATISEAITNFTNYCLARMAAGFYVIVLTVLPRTQAPFTSAKMEGANAFLRDPAHIGTLWHAVGDIQADLRLGTTDLDTSYYVPGGIHPNVVGNRIIVDIVNPLILAA